MTESKKVKASIQDEEEAEEDEDKNENIRDELEDERKGYSYFEISGEEKLEGREEIRDINANRLPIDFHTDRPFKLSTLAFIGFYAADEVNISKYNYTGFGLRCTYFPFLYDLLTDSGVKTPKYTSACVIETKGWRSRSCQMVLYFQKAWNLANTFITILTLKEFVVLLLSWNSRDESISWDYRRKTSEEAYMKYQRLILSSRCRGTLEIQANFMNENSFRDITIRSAHEEKEHILNIPNNFLKEFLQSKDQIIQERFGPPCRKSFLEYLGPAYPDKILACVIGQTPNQQAHLSTREKDGLNL
ncbi:hypothetical protein K501DRAFT_276141 [Backusella circina FSU 941]|nr:hypothetical protein K501DRAFT_276141 [Backusella circina FSU 941]